MPEPRAPAVTVVVCSYNGATTIGACLEALERQSVRDLAQVVVVDDGSTDGTGDIARSFGFDVVVHPVNLGISRARNSGIAVASAPVVAFTDDDCIPDDRWLEALLSGHRREGVVAVGGPVEIYRVETLVHQYFVEYNPLAPLEVELAKHSSLLARVGLYLRRMWLPRTDAEARAVYSFAGANMSFKKEALDAIGGFDERMTFGADDEYVCAKVRERFPRSPLLFEPDAVIRHDYAGTLSDLLRRNFSYGRGHARAYLLGSEHRWPIVFPLPMAVVVCGALLGRRKWVVLLPVLALFLFPQGPRSAVRHRNPAYLTFSFLRLLEETAHNAGMLSGLLTGASPRRRDGYEA
ncbi:MAG: glycosyltransferase [Actinomycetota bacterium]|nr:glycosyltransferase [Actinomycetota bacterium]